MGDVMNDAHNDAHKLLKPLKLQKLKKKPHVKHRKRSVSLLKQHKKRAMQRKKNAQEGKNVDAKFYRGITN